MSERKPTPTDPSASRHRDNHLRTPSHRLSRGDKLNREAFHRRTLTVVLIGVLAAATLALALDLNTWPEWVVLGVVCVTVIGAIIAVSPERRA